MARPGMRTARGFTLVEMMISSAIILVTITGFIGMVRTVLATNASSHRRTVGSFVRSALLDQLAVMPRRIVGTLPQKTWFIDECYDLDSRPSGTNLLRDTGYTCPAGSGYQRWLRVTPVAGAPSSYRINLYVERITSPCTVLSDPERTLRAASDNCVSSDAFVND